MASLTGDRVRVPEDVERRFAMWRGVGALGLCALWGWFGFVKDMPVPLLGFLDIAVHEIGHVLFQPFGEFTMLIMGSGFQVLFPLTIGVVFLAWKRDPIAAGVCFAWGAGAAADASRYIADATEGALALLGGGPDAMGDWERILGPEHLDKLSMADEWATRVRTAGVLLLILGFGLVIGGMWRAGGKPRPALPRRPRIRSEAGRDSSPADPDDMWR